MPQPNNQLHDFQKAKVGDIVRGYQKGIHKVTAITPGCGSGKCFHLSRVLDSNYNKGKGTSTCDGAYIQLLTKEQVLAEVESFTKEALLNVEKYL
jgi:hypothetical protein